MKKMKVNIKEYYPNANYTEYLKRGNPIDKPKNSTLEVGILMYDKINNSIGMILGCIDEEFDGDVRLDSDGMQSIDNLRLAKPTDFKIDGVKFKTDLDKILIKNIMDNLKLVIDSESINIYIDNGDDKEPTHVVYWHEDEWLEDAKFVVPAILRAIDLFVHNPKKLIEILN